MHKRTVGFVGTCLIGGWAASASAEQMVVGGKPIGITVAPYTVTLNMGCTGSWIGGRWALTAKHCVGGGASWIAAGITKKSEQTANTSLRTPVIRVIKHPTSDVAILELGQDVTNPLAKPIRPITAAQTASGLTDPGKPARLSGWGQLGQTARSPDSLHMLDHKIATRGTPTSSMIYFGGAIAGTLQGSCFGDSGGPLAVQDATGTWIQIATVNGGSAVCGDSDPDSYARLSILESWIRQNTGGSVAVYPLPAPNISPKQNRFRLASAQTLVITLRDLSGAQLSRTVSHFEAGEHAFPITVKSASPAILDIQGPQFHQRQRLALHP